MNYSSFGASSMFMPIQTYIPGAQSTLYPVAPPGLFVAGDLGVPKTLASTRYKNFAAPRFTVPAELYLCEVDRSRLESGRAAQSNRLQAKPHHLCLGPEAQFCGELYLDVTLCFCRPACKSSDGRLEFVRHDPLRHRLFGNAIR
jgi:hypothetical protein